LYAQRISETWNFFVLLVKQWRIQKLGIKGGMVGGEVWGGSCALSPEKFIQ